MGWGRRRPCVQTIAASSRHCRWAVTGVRCTDADLSLSGMVGLVADFLHRLDLREVTLVGNDWGGAKLLVTQRRHERLGRLVLAACEAFDNYHRASRPARRAVGIDVRRDLRHGAVHAVASLAARADVVWVDE